MKYKVLHFVRKKSQLNTSFIYNQITNNHDFEPMIVFRKNVLVLNKDVLANILLKSYDYVDLSENETIIEKIKFKTFKTLSKRQLLLIENFIKEKEIDICHFHYGTDCGVFYPLQKKLEIPSVVSFYGYDVFSFPKRFWGFGKKYLCIRVFSKIERILAMSDEMRKDLEKIGCPSEKIEVHYHGVPARIFHEIENPYKQANDEFTLLNISYFDPVKGHIFIFKALKNLISQGFTNIKLRIIGYGFFETKLKAFVDENQLNNYVSFLGPFKYGSAEMISEYKNAHAFIHPSVTTKHDKEGIPGAIVEAMFAGLPIISTYHGGIPFIIENGKTGLLIKEWDIFGLSEAIQKLMVNKNLCEQLGKSGKDFALKFLDSEVRNKNLEKIYSKAINDNHLRVSFKSN